MKKIIYIIPLLFVFIANIAYASTDYDRLPIGTEILSPVYITINYDNYSIDFPSQTDESFKLDIYGEYNEFFGTCFTKPINTNTEYTLYDTVTTPTSEVITGIAVVTYLSADCSGAVSTQTDYEGDGSLEIFTITGQEEQIFETIDNSATGTLATIGGSILGTTIDFATTIFTTYWPFILSFGVLLGLLKFGEKFLTSAKK